MGWTITQWKLTITSEQSNLTQGSIAASHVQLIHIRQVVPICTPSSTPQSASTMERLDNPPQWVTLSISTQDISWDGCFSPSKFPIHARGSGPSSNAWFLGPPESTLQMASWSVQLFLQSSQSWQTDRQTTLLCLQQQAASTAKWRNNAIDKADDTVITAQPLWELAQFIWWIQTQRQVAADPHSKSSCSLCTVYILIMKSNSQAVTYIRSETVPRRADSNCWCNQHSWCDTKHRSHHTEPDTQHIAH